MKSRFLWIGLAIVVITVIAWLTIPSYRNMEGGILVLVGTVTVGVFAIVPGLLELLNLKSNGENGVHAEGDRSVAIGGSANEAKIITGDKNKEKE